jgi:hypothetical protein
MDILQATVNSLAALGIPFNLNSDGTTIEADDIRIHVRKRAIEISRAVLHNPTEKQKSVAFWYEKRRLAEATFFLADKEDNEEVLRLAVRIPVPQNKASYRLRTWKPFVEEALLQLNLGVKKIHDGSWGDVAPETKE